MGVVSCWGEALAAAPSEEQKVVVSGGCLKWDLGKLMMSGRQLGFEGEWWEIGERNNVLEKVVEAAIELILMLMLVIFPLLIILNTVNNELSVAT